MPYCMPASHARSMVCGIYICMQMVRRTAHCTSLHVFSARIEMLSFHRSVHLPRPRHLYEVSSSHYSSAASESRGQNLCLRRPAGPCPSNNAVTQHEAVKDAWALVGLGQLHSGCGSFAAVVQHSKIRGCVSVERDEWPKQRGKAGILRSRRHQRHRDSGGHGYRSLRVAREHRRRKAREARRAVQCAAYWRSCCAWSCTNPGLFTTVDARSLYRVSMKGACSPSLCSNFVASTHPLLSYLQHQCHHPRVRHAARGPSFAKSSWPDRY